MNGTEREEKNMKELERKHCDSNTRAQCFKTVVMLIIALLNADSVPGSVLSTLHTLTSSHNSVR